MNNYKDAAIGKRIKLLSIMKNENSTWKLQEDVPLGTEGTIVRVQIIGDKRYDQITVKWDNGTTLGLFPYKDSYEILQRPGFLGDK